MKRKLDIIRQKKEQERGQTQEYKTVFTLDQKEQVQAIAKVAESIDNLHNLINGQEPLNLSTLEEQLVVLNRKLDLSGALKELKDEVKGSKVEEVSIKQFSSLLSAVKENKPLPVTINLDKLEKAILQVERRIQENTTEPNQAPDGYQPVRRVIKVGNRLVFDDNITRGGGGGGNGGQVALVQGTDLVSTSNPLPVDITDAELTVDMVTSSFDHGRNSDIDTTAEQITATSVTATQGVLIKAAAANTGIIYVGNSDVTANSADATDGFELNPGESVLIKVDNVNKVYAIASAVNQAAYWMVV